VRDLRLVGMAVHIKCSMNLGEEAAIMNSSIHHMPCQIHANGEANVSKYFKPYIKKQDGNEDGMYRKARLKKKKQFGVYVRLHTWKDK
jgi:hypothetical protein